ncbi:hypothetical protein DFJ63DRAFT_288104 [Scheffersomyces coipomensis]|uniref:uncharacterized protein n=1 Tax=Scheffersomyces coipomensis TaxID=1788519 RepID=UPI00315D467D
MVTEIITRLLLYNDQLNSTKPHIPDDDSRYKPPSTRVASYQIFIATSLGIIAFVSFSFLRRKYPKIYVANLNNSNFNYLHSTSRKNLPSIPSNSLFNWIPIVFNISEQQILDHAGLDAVVFLGFFKMGIRALATCVFLAMTVISPIRYIYTGKLDQDYPDDDDDDDNGDLSSAKYIGNLMIRHLFNISDSKTDDDNFQHFLWIYTVFTYVFTFIITYFLFNQTIKIINMRQNHLGKQNSITDKTIKISGIPPILRDEIDLKRHIENLSIGEVHSIVIVKEWGSLNDLFKLRKKILSKLEVYWVEYFKLNGINNKSDLLSSNLHPQLGDSINLNQTSSDSDTNESYIPYRDDVDEQDSTRLSPQASRHESIIDQIEDLVSQYGSLNAADDSIGQMPLLDDELASKRRPRCKNGWLGVFGSEVDAINYWSEQLEIVDKEILRARTREFPSTSTAFVTMTSVAQAQMLAQAVLDPKINHLITELAPAPHDIIWDNLCLTRQERTTRQYIVTIFIGICTVLLVYPVRYLANFLNIKSISKVMPVFGEFLKKNHTLETIVTGLLPTYIFTIFNIIIPYIYIWASENQGFTSHGDEELSSVSKNFFYIFVNLFLIFTVFGTASLSDTLKIAYQLAQSLRDLSLFYVDLIILQGLAIFPFKLLLLGNLFRFSLESFFWCKTPRDYLKLYKPPIFNFGLQLPQPILILIITIVYSIMSTKILTAGLIYFILGYFVCKYQLLYSCVHPPHSTGKVWPLVFRRIMLGLLIFQLTMVGTLLLQSAFLCASFLAPLPIITLFGIWTFQKNYIPLSFFIALRAIDNNHLGTRDEEDIIASTQSPSSVGSMEDLTTTKTLDERREFQSTYEYPFLVDPLDGPIIAIDRNEVLIVDKDGSLVRKPQVIDEWD